ncbi:hypothetical protein ABTM93_19585, partial [Acinetobacter baumannii]
VEQSKESTIIPNVSSVLAMESCNTELAPLPIHAVSLIFKLLYAVNVLLEKSLLHAAIKIAIKDMTPIFFISINVV